MAHKDPLQFNQIPIKRGINGLLVGLIISSIIAFVEFVIILILIISKPSASNEKKPTEDVIISTEALTTEATPTDASTEEVTTEEPATEEPTTEEPTTEAPTTEEVNPITQSAYYSLFANYQNIYNTHQLQVAIESAYLPQLKDIILLQQLQSVGAEDEAGYWVIMDGNIGGTTSVSFEPTAEVSLDAVTIDSLQNQLSEYGFMDPIEQAYSVSLTETYIVAESGEPKSASYNKYIIIYTNGAWWIVGRQAQ